MPLRGADASSALLEVLAVTVWGERDVLIVDMPPGLGDLVLDMIRLLPRAEVVVVTTASRVAVAVVARLLALLEESSVAIAGIIVNMSRDARGGERRPPGLDGRFPVLGSFPSIREWRRPSAVRRPSPARLRRGPWIRWCAAYCRARRHPVFLLDCGRGWFSLVAYNVRLLLTAGLCIRDSLRHSHLRDV